jgi:hypothetical protein
MSLISWFNTCLSRAVFPWGTVGETKNNSLKMWRNYTQFNISYHLDVHTNIYSLSNLGTHGHRQFISRISWIYTNNNIGLVFLYK